MFLFLLLLHLQTSSALLETSENRLSTRNLTCKHDIGLSTTFSQNCEACLVTTRNYPIETTLSLTGVGLSGSSYSCLSTSEVEAYHENLVRECHYFPRNTLNGYDDFCIAPPYNIVRGSYRACICLTNFCNFNFTLCQRQLNPVWNQKTPIFIKTIKQLTQRVSCYRPYDDAIEATPSSLTPLCPVDDDICKSYLFNHGVLCAISVNQANNITTRQTLAPSLYSAYLLKYKTQLCQSFTYTPRSISFSQCELQTTVCMCAFDECNQDLETCSKRNGAPELHHPMSVLLAFVLSFSL